MTRPAPYVSIVVPTIGRPELRRLTGRLDVPAGWELIAVDDRRRPTGPLDVPGGWRVLRAGGRGPAAARNLGWRAARGAWVVFLDDDVVPDAGWAAALAADLAGAGGDVAAVQARIVVECPDRPDDWQRETAGLATAPWITADIAYRRAVLSATGGFDERFPRAFREDAELAYRVRCGGWSLRQGRRTTRHPVRAEGPWVSVTRQRGNADDALLRRLYGAGWHDRLAAPRGRRPWHAATTMLGALALVAVAARRRTGFTVAAAGWAGLTAAFVVHRFRRAPGAARHPVTLIATSVLIPPAAVGAWLRGWWRHRAARPGPVPARAEVVA